VPVAIAVHEAVAATAKVRALILRAKLGRKSIFIMLNPFILVILT